MKICLFIMLDGDFVMPFSVFMKSLLANNKWFKYEIVMLDVGLSAKKKRECLSYYKNIRFIEPSEHLYKGVNFSKTHDKLKKTYYFLEAFSLYEYDRVVSMDVDMIVQGDISEVFDCDADIAGCRAYGRGNDSFADGINAGVFVINERYLNKETYLELIKLSERGFSMPEQKTMNIYFKHKWHYLDKIYNVEKRMLVTRRHKDILENAIVLHYVGAKPWDKDKGKNELHYGELEKIWWEWYYK